MKKSKKNKKTAKNLNKSTMVKILEAIVVIGAVAGVLINFFKSDKSKKKK